jgi:uncharacterized protein (UPF0548 family)
LKRWGHFQLGWAYVDSNTAVEMGQPVCVLAKTLFLWMGSPLRISFVNESKNSFQFAHSCLQGHSLAGEERFSLEWDRDDDSVYYDIFTISRPANPISVLTYPLVRYYQQQFRTESCSLVTQSN